MGSHVGVFEKIACLRIQRRTPREKKKREKNSEKTKLTKELERALTAFTSPKE